MPSVFKRQDERKAMVQFTNVVVNPVKIGRLSKLDSWLTLTGCHFELDLRRETSKRQHYFVHENEVSFDYS